MDPVQTDLKRLGVKPSEEGDYNIHTPPFPGTSKWTCICLQSECFCLTEDSKFIKKYHFEGKCFNILYFPTDFLEDACVISLLCVFFICCRFSTNSLHLNIFEKYPGYRWAETGDITSVSPPHYNITTLIISYFNNSILRRSVKKIHFCLGLVLYG